MAIKMEDWVVFKNACPPGWVHGRSEKDTRDLFFNDRQELVRRFIVLKKSRFKEAVFTEGIRDYQLVVRSDRMRTAGEKLLLQLRDISFLAPSDDLSVQELALWALDYIPRRKLYSRTGGCRTLRASGISVDEDHIYKIDEACFTNDNEFWRAIKHLVDLDIIEVRSEVIIGKKSRPGKNKGSTFYRLKTLGCVTRKEGWSPDDEPVIKAKRALMKEALFWMGWKGQDVIEHSIDGDMCIKMMERVRITLIEIFGESEVEKMDPWLDQINWHDPFL